jgi:hypothetical protein
MRIFLLFFLSVLSVLAVDSEESLTINHHTFDLVQESYREYGDKGVELKIYTHGADKEKLPLLAFTLSYTSGSCAEKSTQEGAYEINGSTMILYTHWERSGRAYDAPAGDRIQVYKVEDNGTITLLSGRLYIERHAKRYDRESGMRYLFDPPKTTQEQKALDDYIRRTEKIFEGRFVQGKEAARLREEVEEALMRKHSRRWR